MKHTPLLENAPRILFHTHSNPDPESEIYFWETLRYSLRNEGYELIKVGYTEPQKFMDVPFIKIPYGLDCYNFLPEIWQTNCPYELSISEADVLERQELWDGYKCDTKTQNKRRIIIQFYTSFYASILQSIQPTLTVIWSGNHAQELILRDICQQLNYPFIYLERGFLAGTFQIDCEGILAGSHIGKLKNWKWQDEKEKADWHSVASRVKENYLCSKQTWYQQNSNIGEKKLREQLKIPDDVKVLLFAGQVNEDTQTFLYSPHFLNNLDAFEWFCQTLANRDDIFILGKHHPMSRVSPEKYQDIIQKLIGNKGCWMSDVSLDDCLNLADRVAAVNSTVLYEALLFDKPILMLGESILSNKNIAYEIKDLLSGIDVVDQWLVVNDFQDRQKRWNDFAAYLLSSSIFTTEPAEKSLGLRGAKAMAEHIFEIIKTNNYQIRVQKHKDNSLNNYITLLNTFLRSFDQNNILRHENNIQKNKIGAMQKSFFWKLRYKWFSLKRFLGFTLEQ